MKTTKSASFAVKHLKTHKENKTKLVMLGSTEKSTHMSNHWLVETQIFNQSNVFAVELDEEIFCKLSSSNL